jgi:hypothetical protein
LAAIGNIQRLQNLLKPYKSPCENIKKEADRFFKIAYKENDDLKFDSLVSNWWELKQNNYIVDELSRVMEGPKTSAFLLGELGVTATPK